MREIHPRRFLERQRTPASQSLSILQFTLDFRQRKGAADHCLQPVREEGIAKLNDRKLGNQCCLFGCQSGSGLSVTVLGLISLLINPDAR